MSQPLHTVLPWTNRSSLCRLTANRCSWFSVQVANRCSEQETPCRSLLNSRIGVPPLGCTPCRSPGVVRTYPLGCAAAGRSWPRWLPSRRPCWSSWRCRSASWREHPGPGPADARPDYIVKSGDTLASIAARADPGRRRSLTAPPGPRGRFDRRGAGRAHPDSLTIVTSVRCPWCGVDDDRVVDSRQAEDGDAIRRRRECLGRGRRFSTLERIQEVPSGWSSARTREPFDRAKVIEGVRAAWKNRPVTDEQMEELAQGVEDALRAETTEPKQPTGRPGRARAAQGSRRRGVPALRQRLQRFRGYHRLPARSWAS